MAPSGTTAVAPSDFPLDEDEDKRHDLEEGLPAMAKMRASPLATAAYVLIVLGYAVVFRTHWDSTKAQGSFFAQLAVVELCLAFEALMYAAGDLSLWRRCSTGGRGVAALAFAGRVRLLMSAIAWAWLVPWAAELSCRCGATPLPQGGFVLLHSRGVATFLSTYFAAREICFFLRGEPPSALDASMRPRFGDCLPSNALLGGQFRIDKTELEETGRIVFVPTRHRQGLYVASGLATVSHLIGGVALGRWGLSGIEAWWWAVGVACALLARKLGGCCSATGRDAHAEDRDAASRPRRRWRCEAARVACRVGELWWIWCCVVQLQQCEAAAQWMHECTERGSAGLPTS